MRADLGSGALCAVLALGLGACDCDGEGVPGGGGGEPRGEGEGEGEGEGGEPGAPQARVEVTPDVIPRGDGHMTVVTLDASASTGEDLVFRWALPDARLESGSSLDGATVQARFPGTADHQWTVTVSNAAGTDSATGTIRLNDPPVALIAEVALTRPGQAVTLDGGRSYDPEGEPLAFAWEVVGAPEGSAAEVEAADAASTSLTPDRAGRYRLQLQVHDGWVGSRPAVTWVYAEPEDLDPPRVTPAVTPTHGPVGESFEVCVGVEDADPEVAFEATVDGESVVFVSGCETWVPQERGHHRVEVVARDTAGNRGRGEASFFVHDGADDGPPTVALTFPPTSPAGASRWEREQTAVDRPVEVTGTVADSDVARYELVATPTGPAAGGEGGLVFATGSSSVEDGVLGVLDPGRLVAGEYVVTLCATDDWGAQTCSDGAWVVLGGPQTPGTMTMGFLDVELEVARIPLKVMRVYDSRDKARRDFGVGWSLQSQWDALFAGPRAEGDDWPELSVLACASGGEAQSDDHLYVVAIDSDWWVYAMTLHFVGGAPMGADCAVGIEYELVASSGRPATFAPAGGTPGEADLYVADGEIVYLSWDELENCDNWPLCRWQKPDSYRLETATGETYLLDEEEGLLEAVDRHGRRFSFGADGVRLDGEEVVGITRDAGGQVTGIRTSDGRSRQYVRNAAGDLVRYVDPGGVATRYSTGR